MDLTLQIWRQKDAKSKGKFVTYPVTNISPNCSFLEMLDILNEQLIQKNEEPVVFDHDCREGICGMCSLYINGRPHGPDDAITTCQLHMRKFRDGDTIWIEPWRAKAFPVIKVEVDIRKVSSVACDAVPAAHGAGRCPPVGFVPVRTTSREVEPGQHGADLRSVALACVAAQPA